MEEVYIFNCELEKCSKYKEKTDSIMPHTSLHYIVDGYGYFNGVRLGKGDFFCAVKNEKVCYFPEKADPWTYIYIDLGGKDAERKAEEYGFKSENAFGKIEFSEEIFEILRLFKAYKQKNIENKPFFHFLALTLLSLHNKYSNSVEGSVTAVHIKKIKEYMELNINRKLTVEAIAKRFYLSRAYVRNIFFSNEGISPKKYMQRLKMEKAAYLLKNTDYKIAEISVSVGYEDQLAFSKAFKNYYGISPLKCRTAEKQKKMIF